MIQFLQIPIEAITSEAYLGAEPVDRATWLNLLAYSFRNLSGGRIEGAAAWKNRKCEQILAVTREEIDRGFHPAIAPVENLRKSCGNPVENLLETSVAKSACGKLSTWKSSLWAIIGDDLIVKFYPFEVERKIVASRENGRKGGRPKSSFPQPKT